MKTGRELRTFLTACATLTGIFAAYVAARQAKLETPFFVIVAASALAAYGRRFGAALVNSLNALRYYRKTLDRVARLEERHQSDLARIAALTEELDMTKAVGVAEGKMQVIGSTLSHRLAVMPSLEAVVIDPQGTPLLIARFEEGSQPFQSARFSLEDKVTGSVKGTVEVQEVEMESRNLVLRPKELTDEVFWGELVRRAAIDSALPPRLRLRPYVFEPPPDLSEWPLPLDQENVDGNTI